MWKKVSLGSTPTNRFKGSVRCAYCAVSVVFSNVGHTECICVKKLVCKGKSCVDEGM